MDARKYWYDVVVAPFESLTVMCEQVENRGWEVVNTFPAGVAQIGSALLDKGGGRPMTTLIAALCRIERRTNEARPEPGKDLPPNFKLPPTVFPAEMMAKNIKVVGGEKERPDAEAISGA